MATEPAASPNWQVLYKVHQEHPPNDGQPQRRLSVLAGFRRSAAISFSKILRVKRDPIPLQSTSHPSQSLDDVSRSREDNDTRSIQTVSMKSVFDWIAHKESEVERNLADHEGMTIEQYEERGSWVCPAPENKRHLCRYRTCRFHYPREVTGTRSQSPPLDEDRMKHRQKKKEEREAIRRANNPSKYCPPEWHMDRLEI